MKFYWRELSRVLQVLIPKGSSVAFGPDRSRDIVELLQPSSSVSVANPAWGSGEKVSRVVLLGWHEEVEDIYLELESLRNRLNRDTRIVVVSVNRLWKRLHRVIQRSRNSGSTTNWIPPMDLVNLFEQAQFELIEQRREVLAPVFVPIVSRLLNKWMSDVPLVRHFSLFNVLTFRPLGVSAPATPSVSIIVAARNEQGNIKSLVERLPRLAETQELIFVEGGSSDGTWNEISSFSKSPTSPYGFPIRAYQQTGRGKGDAVRLGFQMATGDILIILDADLSVPPEELPRFIQLLVHDHCEFANGSRLVYQMDDKAMQFLNLVGNRVFGVLFTFLLGQQVRDTLCGTKALWAQDYQKIAAERHYFGDFDPFGDFDLLFGAARNGLKIRDVPVHYKERTYGSTNISRFRHGLLLIRMTAIAARRLRFI